MKFIRPTFYALLILSVFGLNAVGAAQLSSSYSFNKLQSSLCENAKLNQVIKLRFNLRKARTHIRTIYAEVNCQGASLLSIAAENNAEEMVAYLKLKTESNSVVKDSRIAAK